MKKVISLILLFPFLISQTFAYGQTGHRVVGLVAEKHLSKKARKKVLQILGNNSLSEVANFMDDVKSDPAYNHTHDWHWVTIPDGMKYEQTQKNLNGDLILKLEELIQTLKAHNLTAVQEQENLKFLIHMVGDLHQPLHVGGQDDMGGNNVKVQWFGKASNLHRVWDSEIIDGKDLSYTELASFLDEPNKAEIKNWQSTSIRDWAYGMMQFRPQIYAVAADGKLGYRYSYDNFGTIQKLLMQGGIRLAGLLNQIYG
ncbi:S1/P1 nuclease [Adhaeribacter radiodurans]|uniref:S1/P1 nuclease n=1 Tax=Adhaeribacter radiodurans TaxID=2745197 RepID=A0A7L7L346_9BACT|nr:S1/P1 nuclease [Adhaeribacter radiodurans]QMU27218.1 S1/P1 nuclease [Adhaeribacter radiodurans]